MDLNSELLQHFMTTFYGSGNYDGDYWFVGMEEGGGKDLGEVTERFNAWNDLGATELVDIYDFHLKIGFLKFFTGKAVIQPTWEQQARIVLASKGRPSGREDVRTYQRDFIGRKSGETCLLELFPLPSPGVNHWNYGLWSELSFLKDRDIYRDYCAPWRIEHIRLRIQEYKPKFVVFMGMDYKKYWYSIAGLNLSFDDKGGFKAGSSEGTTYVMTWHPTASGIKNEYFEKIGEYISQFI